jgi:hypothetical protein
MQNASSADAEDFDIVSKKLIDKTSFKRAQQTRNAL